jgi:lysophospholipid acyltransferase (LPLAT)-like uncharacterized protein
LLQIILQLASYHLTVSTPDDPVYKPAALSSYSLKERLMIRLASAVFHSAIRLICSTVKYEVIGGEHLDSIEKSGRIPIYTFWHDRIFAGTYFFRDRGIVVMTSQSFDGEYIARFIQHLGYGAIRGSSTRGGSKALVQMIRAMRDGLPMAFTADGPRGPRYVAKPGPVLLAKKTGNPIMPFILEPRSRWQLNSWDRMQIPKPFTRVALVIGEPIYVGEDDDVDAKLLALQRRLDEVVDVGNTWRESCR